MVQFGHGYDQTPLEVITGRNKRTRISMQAASQGLSKSRTNFPYVVPIKRMPDASSTDQGWINGQKRKQERGGIAKARKQPRFYDMDYSYRRIELRDRLLDINPTPPPFSDLATNWDLDVDPTPPLPDIATDGHTDSHEQAPGTEKDCEGDILHMGIILAIPNNSGNQCEDIPWNGPPQDPNNPNNPNNPNDPNDPNADPNGPEEDPVPAPEEPQTMPYNPDDTNLQPKEWVAKYQNQDGTYTIPNSSSKPITTLTVFNATDPATQWIKDFLVKVMGYGVFASSGQKSLEWYGLNRSDVQLRFKTGVYDPKLGGPFVQLQTQFTNVPASKRVWNGVWTGQKNEMPITNFSGPQPKPDTFPYEEDASTNQNSRDSSKVDPWKVDPWKLPPCIIM